MLKLTLGILLSLGIYVTGFTQTIIKASLPSLPETEFSLTHNSALRNQYQGEVLATGTTGKKGTLELSFNITTEKKATLFIGNQFYRLWLIPNTTLTIEEQSDGRLVFSGAAAMHNNFLRRAGIMSPMGEVTSVTGKGFEPGRQTAFIDSVELQKWGLYKTMIDTSRVSKKFINYCKAHITYWGWFYKNQYAQHHIYVAKSVAANDIPASYFSFWKAFQLLGDEEDINYQYQICLRDYIGYLTTQSVSATIDASHRELFNQAEFKITDSLLARHPFTKKELKAEMILFCINYFDMPQVVQQQLTSYEKEFTGTPNALLLADKWAKKNNSRQAKPAFALKDTAGNVVDIQSLRGKVVYIDFWGAWCKACMGQMPYSAKLQQRFKNKPVVFLFIDFYDKKSTWIRTIQSRRLKGLHLKAEPENQKYFNEIFGIDENGFPHYALLDKNGVLVTSAAPHPGDAAAATLIEKYIR
jgi:thiol-disulfide isomerase/thioredoxin